MLCSYSQKKCEKGVVYVIDLKMATVSNMKLIIIRRFTLQKLLKSGRLFFYHSNLLPNKNLSPQIKNLDFVLIILSFLYGLFL